MPSTRHSNTVPWYFVGLLSLSTTVSAHTFIVNSTSDQLDANINDGICATMNSACTLRAAVQQANELPGPDVIQVPAGLYLLNIDTSATATAEQKSLKGDLDILDDLEIVGLGVSPVQTPEPQTDAMTVIDAGSIDRVFDIRAGKTVKFSNLVVQNGKIATESGAGIDINPAYSTRAIQVSIEDVMFRNNSCIHGDGGAINAYSQTDLTIKHSIFHDNIAVQGGAINLGNSSSNKSSIADSTFNSNIATTFGGAIHSESSYSGSISVINSVFNENSARSGGGIYASDIVIADSRFTHNLATVPQTPQLGIGGGLTLTTAGPLYIHNTLFENNSASGFGGAIAVYPALDTVAHSVKLFNNYAGLGGGGLYSAGSIELSDTTMDSNTTDGDGAGLYIFRNTVTINHASITNNQALNRSTVPSKGGGIYIAGGGRLNASALTLSSNKVLANANHLGSGGGLYLDVSVIPASAILFSGATITHGSLVLNEAGNGGNIAANMDNQGILGLTNSILQQAPGHTNCGTEFSSGITLTAVSANIASDSSCGVTSAGWTIADPGIDTLAALNGGTTLNHALLSTAAARNASQSNFCEPLDQRYFLRDVADGTCDIGATEFSSTRVDAGIFDFERNQAIGETYMVSESTPSVTLQVVRRGGATGNVAVQYRTRAASAKESSDYTAETGTLLFSDNVLSMPITLTVRNDYEFELDETFYLELYHPQNGASLGEINVAQIVIQDSGSRQPTTGSFSFSTTAQTVSESEHRRMIKVIRTSGSDSAVAVDYELVTTGFMTGTRATPGEDFLLTNGTLHFPHGVTEQSFFIDILDDNIYQGDKKVEIKLVNPQGGAIQLYNDKITLTIDDDELRPPKVEFVSFLPIAVNEGDPINNSLLQFFVWPGETLTPASVDYRVSGGSATSGVDYQITNGTIHYDPANPYKTTVVSIPVTILDDQEIEPVETIVVELVNFQGNIHPGTITSASIRISDNDKAPPAYGEFAFEQSQYSVDELAQVYKIRVMRRNGSNGVASVDYKAIGGTAVSDLDYALVNGSLTFNPGEIVKEIPVTIIDDQGEEPSETIQLELSNNTGGAIIGLAQTSLTIKANDIPIPVQGEFGFEQIQYFTDENITSFMLNVVRSNVGSTGATGTVSVDYKVTGGTATRPDDYILADGRLTFNDTETSKPIVFSIIDDAETESNESISVELSNSLGGAVIGRLSQTSIVIRANDQPVPIPSTVRFPSDKMSVSESIISHNIDVFRQGTEPSSVNVSYSVTGGSASDGRTGGFSDFSIFSSTLYFGPGEIKKTINLSIIPDLDIEADETIELTLSAENPMTIGSPSTLTITIVDDDADFPGEKPNNDASGGGAFSLLELIVLCIMAIYVLFVPRIYRVPQKYSWASVGTGNNGGLFQQISGYSWLLKKR